MFTACEDPELNTNLRPEGDPEVLAVLAYTTDFSPGHVALEQATYCADDEKAPGLVGLPDATSFVICPDDGTAVDMVTNTVALRPQVRIVFDELLNPNVEELVDVDTGGACTEDSTACSGTIAATQPVSLECGGTALAYDGYYAPNGNSQSYPPGPSLVVIATDPVPGGAICSVTLNDVARDKDGNPVPEAQRGPFEFGIEPFAIAGTDPAPSDPAPEVASDSAVLVLFNNYLDISSVDADADVVLNDGANDVAITVSDAGNGFSVVPTAGFVEGTTYTLTVPTGATFTDLGGGTLTTTEDVTLTFTVVAPPMM